MSIPQVHARSSVELIDSCNCNQCCPRSCGCWPRRVRPHRQTAIPLPPKDPNRLSDHMVDEASKVAQEALNDQLKDK